MPFFYGRRFFMLKTLFATALTAAVAGSTVAGDVPSIYSPRNVRIDGKLDDAVYRKAPVIKNFTRADGRAVERATECQIVFTPTSVVFAFTAYIPKDKLQLPAAPTLRDKSSTSCDAVEIMCDPTGDVDTYKHFILNASGGILDRLCEQGGYVGDIKWDADWQYKHQIFNDRWTCEIAIPYRSLGITSTNRNWKLNLARESFGAATAPWELTSICKGKFNVSGDFLTLKVPPQVKLEQYMLFAGNPSIKSTIKSNKSYISVTGVLENLQAAPVKLNGECVILIPGKTDLRSTAQLQVAGKGKQEVKFPDLVLEKPGIYQANMIFRHPFTNRILLKKSFTVDARYTPIKIALQDPHYRNMIFATQKLDKVRFTVDVNAAKNAGKMVCGIKDAAGKVIVQQEAAAGTGVKFEFPAASLPYGKMMIFVSYNGETSTHPLRKLPFKAGEVWRGKDGNWYRDGKKIFINSTWSHPEGTFPENNILFTGAPPEDKRLFVNSNLMLGRPAKMVQDMKQGKLTPEVFDFYRKKVEMRMNDPQIFAHFLCDEPDIMGFTQESFAELSAFIADVDPYHPIFNSTGSTGLIDFADSSELNGFHPYPRPSRTQPMAHFDKIVYLMDRGNEYFAKTNRKISITFLHQGFDYSDSGLSNSHVPSYEEFRNQNMLSLVLGGIGIMQYNRGVLNFPELYIGLPNLTQELHVVGNEAVIQPDAAEKCTSVSKNLRTLAKYNPETKQYWVLVFNASFDTAKYKFAFKPFAGKKLQVLTENRTVTIGSDGIVQDEFTPYQAHIYTTDLRDFKLKSIKEVNAAIEDVYAKLAKENAQNLVYQRLEDQAVKVTASSNKFNIVREENSLWHIADGITDGEQPCNSPGGFGIVHWCDKTPKVFPDWINMEFVKKPQTVGRVEVYPVGNSLKDYEIQLLVNGKYVTVATVKNASGRPQTCTFKPQQCDAVRLVATAGNEAYTRIYEIKVFAK